jgi:hypothetical protein
MAKTMYDGTLYTSSPLVTGAGRLLGFLISHAQATVQTITFYDNTSAASPVLLTVHVDPTESPFWVYFPRDQGVPFSTGLSIDNASGNADVAVWAIGFG